MERTVAAIALVVFGALSGFTYFFQFTWVQRAWSIAYNGSIEDETKIIITTDKGKIINELAKQEQEVCSTLKRVAVAIALFVIGVLTGFTYMGMLSMVSRAWSIVYQGIDYTIKPKTGTFSIALSLLGHLQQQQHP